MAERPIGVGVIGCDHRHIYGMLQGMLDVGAVGKAWWTEGEPQTLAGWSKRFPTLPRVADYRQILDDPTVDLVLIAAVPCDRTRLAVEAMAAGKDVMVDKPGCTSLDDLAQIRAATASTGRIWSVNFSEHFEVPAVTRALELVRTGAIGCVVQTVGLGPHRLNPGTRPPWFYQPEKTGGILCDIGSHQIDQFMVFTGSTTVDIVSASSGNFANPDHPAFEDLARCCCAETVAKAMCGSTGTHPTRCPPGATAACLYSAPKAPSSCASTWTWPAAPAPTTCC